MPSNPKVAESKVGIDRSNKTLETKPKPRTSVHANTCVPFSDLIGCAQDAWIYEAILDGANIWWTYQQYLHQKTWGVDDIEQKQDLLLDYMLVDLMDVFNP